MIIALTTNRLDRQAGKSHRLISRGETLLTKKPYIWQTFRGSGLLMLTSLCSRHRPTSRGQQLAKKRANHIDFEPGRTFFHASSNLVFFCVLFTSLCVKQSMQTSELSWVKLTRIPVDLHCGQCMTFDCNSFSAQNSILILLKTPCWLSPLAAQNQPSGTVSVLQVLFDVFNLYRLNLRSPSLIFLTSATTSSISGDGFSVDILSTVRRIISW